VTTAKHKLTHNMSASNLMNGLLESLSRCFNPPAGATTGAKSTVESGSTPKRAAEPSRERSDGVSERQRRTGRIELHDQEWDKLFDADNRKKAGKKRDAADFEMSYGEVIQKAREAAQPARTRQRKSDIFRSREPAQLEERNTGSVASFFKEHSQFLCFANPIGETVCGGSTPIISPAAPIRPARSIAVEDDDSATVDTMTSTQYFDRKHNVSGSKAQPMPLFSEFRIDCLDWSSGDNLTMSEVGVEDLRSRDQKIFKDFEKKIKNSPPRDKQIQKAFIPSRDPMDMPDIVRLSGSQSTVDESSSFALQKNRSSSSRGSINNTPRRKAKKVLPRI